MVVEHGLQGGAETRDHGKGCDVNGGRRLLGGDGRLIRVRVSVSVSVSVWVRVRVRVRARVRARARVRVRVRVGASRGRLGVGLIPAEVDLVGVVDVEAGQHLLDSIGEHAVLDWVG